MAVIPESKLFPGCKRYLSVREAARLLDMTEQTIRNRIYKGRFKVISLGQRGNIIDIDSSLAEANPHQ